MHPLVLHSLQQNLSHVKSAQEQAPHTNQCMSTKEAHTNQCKSTEELSTNQSYCSQGRYLMQGL